KALILLNKPRQLGIIRAILDYVPTLLLAFEVLATHFYSALRGLCSGRNTNPSRYRLACTYRYPQSESPKERLNWRTYLCLNNAHAHSDEPDRKSGYLL